MTVPATSRRAGPYTGNGVTTSFGFTFKTFAATDLRVVKLNTVTAVETDAVLTTEYTVTLNPDQDSNPGGNVVFLAAPSSTTKVTIIGALDYSQPTDLPDGGAYRAQQVEDALDRLAIQAQQLVEETERTIKLQASVTNVNPELPAPGPLQLIGWNSNGDQLANYDATALGVSVAYATWRTQTFNGTGAQTSFVLDFDAGSASNIDLRVNNVPQTPDVNYSYNNVNRTITFLTGAPASGTGNVVARYGQGLSEPNIAASIAAAAASANTATTQAGIATAGGNTATTQAGIATTQAGIATTQAGIATTAANNAAASFDSFDDRYLGPKSSDPALDNDNNALLVGALYWNTVTSTMRAFNGTNWVEVTANVSVPNQTFNGNGTTTNFTLSAAPGSLGSLEVFVSGVRQVPTTNYTVSGTTLTFVVAPPDGTVIFARWITTQAINVPAVGSVTGASLDNATGARLGAMKNRIINGKMEIAQRGTSFAAPASGVYTLDRWFQINSSTAVFTVSQQADAPASNEFQNSLRVAITTADASLAAAENAGLIQYVEGYNARDLIGRTFTLSFWVRSSKTGAHCASFLNGGLDRSYVAEYTINAANTWEQKSITVSGGLITAGTWNWTNGRGLALLWCLGSGTTRQTTANAWQTGEFYATANQVNCLDSNTNIFAITGVQLEVGSVATPFEHRPFGTELALCQRYFYRVSAAGVNNASLATGFYSTTTQFRFYVQPPVVMRVAPSGITASAAGEFTTQGSSNIGPSAITFNRATPQLVEITATVAGATAGQGGQLFDTSGGDAFIDLTGAEL